MNEILVPIMVLKFFKSLRQISSLVVGHISGISQQMDTKLSAGTKFTNSYHGAICQSLLIQRFPVSTVTILTDGLCPPLTE